MALGTLILNAFSVRAAPDGAATLPSKTMCRQTLTTPGGPERHRRFYLAVAKSVVSPLRSRNPPLPLDASVVFVLAFQINVFEALST